jgi:hypothetical protein
MSPISTSGKVVLSKPTGYKVKLANTSQDADQYFSAVSLLLDGTDLQDKSLDTKAITVNGDAQVSTAQSKWNGSSLAFDGTGDYLTSSANNDFVFGTDDFTVEAWVRFNSVGSSQTFVSYVDSASSGGTAVAWVLELHSNSTIRVFLYSGSTAYVNTNSTSISADTWYHVAACRNSGNLQVFVNGQGSTASAANVTINNPAGVTLNVSKYFNATPRYVNGYIQDLRITKGVARYTATFTPPTQPFMQV